VKATGSSSQNRPGRKSGIVVPQKPKWNGEIAAFVIWILGSALAKSWRVTMRDESGLFEGSAEEATTKGPVVFALWHNRLAVAMSFWAWVRQRRPEAGLAALISASRDGGLLARTFENFGVTPVRGSSSRRGAQALVELVKALRANYHIAITPDGPRGPKYRVQLGIISLAQHCGVPIVPAGAKIHSKKVLRSWDAFQIPWPFARCELVFGKPIFISKGATEEERERALEQLEAELKRINPD
jgi:lysophospholipid acyltransferase (LPLAT)-like uncharacterized protein